MTAREKAILDMCGRRVVIVPLDIANEFKISRKTGAWILASLCNRGYLRRVLHGQYRLPTAKDLAVEAEVSLDAENAEVPQP